MKIKGFEKVSVWVVTVLLALFLAPLIILSFPHSYVNVSTGIERVFLLTQNPVTVILCTVFFIAGLYIITALLCLIPEKQGRIIIPAVTSLAAFVIAFIWVTGSRTYPQADQEYTYLAGVLIAKGDAAMKSDEVVRAYIQMYPQQLGLAMFHAMLIRVSGVVSPKLLLNVNVFCVPVIFTGIYITAYKISKSYRCAVAALLLCLTCLPLYFYTSYDYGEITSTTFSLVCIILSMSISEGLTQCFSDMTKSRRAGYILSYIGCFVFAFLAAMVRMNSLIVMIAIAVVILVKVITVKKPIGLIVMVCVLVGALLPGKISKAVYADALDGKDGMPAVLWIAMGMQETDSACGWNNYYNVTTFTDSGCDSKASSEQAKKDIIERIGFFAANPGEAAQFYLNKYESQWNCPLYQSVQMNSRIEGTPDKIQGSILFFENAYYMVRSFSNIHHSAVFLCALIGLIYMLVRRKRIENYIIPVVIVGGMLFSLMWEGKARYCFPYYVFILVLSAAAMEPINDMIHRILEPIRSKMRKS